MPKKTAPKRRSASLSIIERVNFLRAYLSDLSAIRANLTNSFSDADGMRPSAAMVSALNELDQEIGGSLRALMVLRKELAPNPAATPPARPKPPGGNLLN